MVGARGAAALCHSTRAAGWAGRNRGTHSGWVARSRDVSGCANRRRRQAIQSVCIVCHAAHVFCIKQRVGIVGCMSAILTSGVAVLGSALLDSLAHGITVPSMPSTHVARRRRRWAGRRQSLHLQPADTPPPAAAPTRRRHTNRHFHESSAQRTTVPPSDKPGAGGCRPDPRACRRDAAVIRNTQPTDVRGGRRFANDAPGAVTVKGVPWTRRRDGGSSTSGSFHHSRAARAGAGGAGAPPSHDCDDDRGGPRACAHAGRRAHARDSGGRTTRRRRCVGQWASRWANMGASTRGRAPQGASGVAVGVMLQDAVVLIIIYIIILNIMMIIMAGSVDAVVINMVSGTNATMPTTTTAITATSRSSSVVVGVRTDG